MRRAVLGLLALAGGCGGDDGDDGLPPVPVFTTFGIVNTKTSVRPWGCVQAELQWAADRPIDPADIVWSSDDLYVIPYFYLPTHAYATVCSKGESGTFHYKVGLASVPDYYVTGDLFVQLGDAQLYTGSVPEVLGSSNNPPLRVQWASDGSEFFVSGMDRTLVKYSGTTGELVTGWYTYSEQAALLDNNRVAIAIDSRNIGILELVNFTLDTYFEGLGIEDFLGAPFLTDRVTSADPSDVIAVGGAGTKITSWEVKPGQNSEFCRIGVLDTGESSRGTVSTPTPAEESPAGLSAPDRFYLDHSNATSDNRIDRLSLLDYRGSGPSFPSGQFVPDTFVEMSAGGRYVAFGYGGCNRGNTLYDTHENRACDIMPGGYNDYQHHGEFSRDESTYAAPASGSARSITVFKTDTCEKLGGFATPFSPHLGFGISPDGRTLATASDFVGSSIRVILWDIRPDNPAWGTTDFDGFSEIGATRVLTVNIEYNSAAVNVPTAHRVAFSPDGNKLAVVAPNGRTALLDLTQPDGAPKYSLQLPITDSLLITRLSPTTRYLWVQAQNGANSRGQFAIYDIDGKREVRRFNESIQPTEIVLEDTTFAIHHDADNKWYRASYADPYTETELATAPPAQPPPTVTDYGQCGVLNGQLCNTVNSACIDVSAVVSAPPIQRANMISPTTCMVREVNDVWTWTIGQPKMDFRGRVAGALEEMVVHRLSNNDLLFVGAGRLTRWRL